MHSAAKTQRETGRAHPMQRLKLNPRSEFFCLFFFLSTRILAQFSPRRGNGQSSPLDVVGLLITTARRHVSHDLAVKLAKGLWLGPFPVASLDLGVRVVAGVCLRERQDSEGAHVVFAADGAAGGSLLAAEAHACVPRADALGARVRGVPASDAAVVRPGAPVALAVGAALASPLGASVAVFVLDCAGIPHARLAHSTIPRPGLSC